MGVVVGMLTPLNSFLSITSRVILDVCFFLPVESQLRRFAGAGFIWGNAVVSCLMI